MSRLSDDLEPVDTGVECPDCGELTAEQTDTGAWICHAGCQLGDCYYCPCCGRLFKGTQGYCDSCMSDM